MRIRHLIFVAASVGIPCAVLIAPIGTGPASATVTGTGTVTCEAATGSIHYSPPWSDSDSNSVITARIHFKFTSCSGGSPAPAFFKASGKLTFLPAQSDNACTGEEEAGASGSLKFTYGPGIAPSKLTGPIWVSNPTEPFVFMEDGGDAISGSYAVGNGLVQISLEETSATGNCTSGVKAVVLHGGEAFKM